VTLTVAALLLQEHDVVSREATLAVALDASLLGSANHAELLPAKVRHLWHEGELVLRPFRIQRGEDFARTSDYDIITGT
jgi:hypothetical protein